MMQAEGLHMRETICIAKLMDSCMTCFMHNNSAPRVYPKNLYLAVALTWMAGRLAFHIFVSLKKTDAF